jgi:protein arginine kinase
MMRNGGIDMLLKRKVGWLADSGPEDDIAISTRIRLARNLVDFPFPIAAGKDALLSARDEIIAALRESSALVNPLEFDMDQLSELDRKALLERRLVSREFLHGRPGSALVVSSDEHLGVMINEEDHLRIQALRPGFQLREVWTRLDAFDSDLSRSLPFAFDKNLGFLTSCPTNVGTGMRASVMLHLPGLVLSGQINAVIQGVNKLGLASSFLVRDRKSATLPDIQPEHSGESEEQIVERSARS